MYSKVTYKLYELYELSPASNEMVEKRKRKRQNENGREAYKDVRPAPLDVRQRGTPELEFSFAEDVPLFWGNLFRACRSVRSELRGLRRADGGSEAESGYARCQILRAMLLPPSSFVTTMAGAILSFLSFFCCDRAVLFFYSYSFFLSFSLSLSVFALSAVERSFRRKSYGSLASASASTNASAPLILGRAKGGVLARSQTFFSRTGRTKRGDILIIPRIEFISARSIFWNTARNRGMQGFA